jgi:hypothetical protein
VSPYAISPELCYYAMKSGCVRERGANNPIINIIAKNIVIELLVPSQTKLKWIQVGPV